MSELLLGFARVNIDPPLGCGIAGYFIPRIVDGYLDPLEINAIALSKDGTTVIIASSDTVEIAGPVADSMRKAAAEAASVPEEAVFITAVHTHTGPFLDVSQDGYPPELTAEITEYYCAFFREKLAEASRLAVSDMKPAKLSSAVSRAKNISFVRTYRMKDGSIRTNPGFNNPDVVEPVGECDDEVSVLRFDRADGKTFVIADFACHADTIGGTKTSSDWPGIFRRKFEERVPDSKCLFINGMMGDINHVNVMPDEDYLSRVTMDFDDVPRGYKHAEYMADVLTDAVYDADARAETIEADKIGFAYKTLELPANVPSPEEIPEAHRISALHAAGRDCELPYEGMQLTTVVAEAERICRLENGPATIPMGLSVVTIGDVSLVGAPGEPFNKVGIDLKKANGWKTVLPCSLTNGYIGYFPTMDAYNEGGYEARSSLFRAGVAEFIVKESLALLDSLK